MLSFEGRDGQSILTIDAFKEMIDFHKAMTTQIWNQRGDQMRFYDDLCVKFEPSAPISYASCTRDPLPIDFVWSSESNSYDLERYAKTDEDLLSHIQMGKTERDIFRVDGNILILDRIFGTISATNYY